jgi:hypothetical protein
MYTYNFIMHTPLGDLPGSFTNYSLGWHDDEWAALSSEGKHICVLEHLMDTFPRFFNLPNVKFTLLGDIE